MTDAERTALRDLVHRLREWRAGVHYVVDEGGAETGEMVDEPKDFATMQREREEAASAIDDLLGRLERAAMARPDAVREEPS